MASGDQAQREIRAARNQSTFREINERLEGLAESFEFVARRAVFVCECADTRCVEAMSLSLAEYETVRAGPNRFAVLPGHVFADVERVLDENATFVVVAKIGEGAEVAARADPRSE